MGVLAGKVAVVTGAASGIGEAIAARFVAEGASVVLADISGNEQAVAADLGDRALGVHADVSIAADVQAMIAAAVDRFGGLDVLCNNAGIEGSSRPIVETPDEEFDRIIQVNLVSVFLGLKYGVPAMIARGGGSIVNTASIAGLVGFGGVGPYGAAKAGIVQLTRVAALEVAQHGIRVNAICPAAVLTPLMRAFADREPERAAQVVAQQPISRFAEPTEIAHLAVYLASDASSFVTGTAIPIDGGYTAR